MVYRVAAYLACYTVSQSELESGPELSVGVAERDSRTTFFMSNSRIFELALSNPNHGFGVFVERESKISETNIRFVIHCFRWSDWYELGPSTN